MTRLELTHYETLVLLRFISATWQAASEEGREEDGLQALRAIALRLQEAGVET